MDDGTEEFYDGLLKVIHMVKANRDSWPFKEPVVASEVPQYYEAIKKPIDLATIEEKILMRSYKKLKHVEKDFKLLVNNCETFNGDRNGYTIMVYAVWRTFKRGVAKHLGRELRKQEDETFLYTPPKITSNRPPTAAIEARKRKSRGGCSDHRHQVALDEMAAASEVAIREAESCLSDHFKSLQASLSWDNSSSGQSVEKNEQQQQLIIKEEEHHHLMDENANSMPLDLSSSSKPAAPPQEGTSSSFLNHSDHSQSETNSSHSSETTSPKHDTAQPVPPCPENGNLVFKSLSEWSASLPEPVTLPEDSFRFTTQEELSNALHGGNVLPPESGRTQLSVPTVLTKHKPLLTNMMTSSTSSSSSESETLPGNKKNPKLPNLIIRLPKTSLTGSPTVSCREDKPESNQEVNDDETDIDEELETDEK